MAHTGTRGPFLECKDQGLLIRFTDWGLESRVYVGSKDKGMYGDISECNLSRYKVSLLRVFELSSGEGLGLRRGIWDLAIIPKYPHTSPYP